MSAKTAIRKYCKWCCLDSNVEITNCPSEDCSLWPFREGMSFKGERKQRAIKQKCNDCMQTPMTKGCKEKLCQLYLYRDGKRPKNNDTPKRNMPPKQLEKMKNGLILRRKQNNA